MSRKTSIKAAILILTKCVREDVGWQLVRYYYEEIGFELIERA
jgi:hypothetical protein